MENRVAFGKLLYKDDKILGFFIKNYSKHLLPFTKRWINSCKR
jgi:hypothetical protein